MLTGKQQPFVVQHNVEISELALSQFGTNVSDRRITFIDKNREMYISPICALPGEFMTKFKLHTQVDSMIWNDKSDMLTAIADCRLLTWYYPNVVYVDRELLK